MFVRNIFLRLLFAVLLIAVVLTAAYTLAETTDNVTATPSTTVSADIQQPAVITPTPTVPVTAPTLSILATRKPPEPPPQPELPSEGEVPGQYPKLNIEGYKEYEFMKMEKEGDPRQYENDAGYKAASAKILPTAGKAGLLRERLRLDIEGKLSDKLSVSYHLEQEPDIPDKFDIRVRYDKTELMFGDFNAQFQTKEFVNFSKAVNGFQLTSYDNWYDLKLVTAKEKSTAKEVSFQGNGLSVYSLGQTSILEGSVKVYVNNLRLEENTDYTIDYFEGKITFKTIKSSSDAIRVQYEFTDPIEELIPVATKVDFFGLQGTVRTFEEPRREKVISSVEQKLQYPVDLKNVQGPQPPGQAAQTFSGRTTFIVEGTPIVFGSEEVYLNGKLMKLNEDYLLNYDTGELRFQNITVQPSDELMVKYQYTGTKKLAETFNGDEKPGPYMLQHTPVLRKSVKVFVDSQILEEGKDFTLDYQKGEIIFSLPIARTQKITVEYAYIMLKEISAGEKPKEAFSLQTTYLKETADAGKRGENIISTTDDTGGGITVSQNGALIILDPNKLPVKADSITAVLVNGVAWGSYTVEGYRGHIIPSPSIPASASVQVAYDYYKTNLLPIQTYSMGTGMSELILEDKGNKYLPVAYHSEEVYYRFYDSSAGIWRENILHRGETYVWGPLQVSTDGKLIEDDKEDYWARGYMTFITKNAANAWIPYQFKSGDQIKIKYRYAPGEQPDFGRITHEVYGVNTQYLINPNWLVGVEAMKSELNFNRAVMQGSDSFVGTGVYGASYALTQKEIVENSDQIYLNDMLQSRNDDYVLQYTTGVLRFKNGRNPGPSDNIRATYQYYDPNQGELKRIRKEGTAFKGSTAVKAGDFTVASNIMTIDKDFNTIGAMRQAPGTKLGDISVVYQPGSTVRIGTFVENKSLLLGSRDNNEPWYKSSYFQKHDAYWEFLPQQTLQLDYQQTDVIQESQTVTTKNLDLDTLDRNYSGKLTFGPDYLRTMYEEKRTEAYADFVDRKDLLTTLGTYRHVNNVYRPFSILTFTTDYQYDHVDADIHPWYIQNTNRYQETIDYLPYSFWSNKLDYSRQLSTKQTQIAPRRSTESVTELTNYYYATTFTRPPDWTDPFWSEFYTHFDRSYSQAINPLVNQAPDTDDKDNFNQSLRPWDLFKLSWDATRFNGLKGNEMDITDKYTHKTAFEDFRPLKLWEGSPLGQNFFIVERISYGEGVYNRFNKLQSASSSGNSTFEENYDLDVGLRMEPLDHTVLKYTYYEGNRQTMYDLYTGLLADTTFTDRPQEKRTYGLSYTPGNFTLPLLLVNPTVTNLGFWADRTYGSVNDDSERWLPNTVTSTITKKDSDTFEDNQNLKFNPFPSLALDMKRKDTNEFFVQTGTGTRESAGLMHDLHWTNDIDSPIGGFQLFGFFNGNRAQQYSTPWADASLEQLYDNFDTRLWRLDQKENYGLGYTPFAQLTLRASYTNNDIWQEQVLGAVTSTNATEEESYINSQIYSAGAIYRPISGMTLTYDWDLRRFMEGQGERCTITAKYQPFDWLLGHCIFHYEYVHNSGYGLNEIDQMIAANRQEGFIATTVGKVDNERMTGSLDLQILNDINSVVVEGTEVVATWTLIRLADKMNADNNYSVNAFYLKGRIIF